MAELCEYSVLFVIVTLYSSLGAFPWGVLTCCPVNVNQFTADVMFQIVSNLLRKMSLWIIGMWVSGVNSDFARKELFKMLRNRFSKEIVAPPPRTANNVESDTSVTLFRRNVTHPIV